MDLWRNSVKGSRFASNQEDSGTDKTVAEFENSSDSDTDTRGVVSRLS
jgi:hypothetical protein